MSTRAQFVRYVVVGLASNAVIFVVYVVLTNLGLGPKLAMSLLYCTGVLQTFVFNRKWAFRFQGAATPALGRYLVAYALGYLVNFLALMLLVDRMGLPHQWVQIMMILVVAMMLFMAQRYWVFRNHSTHGTE